MATPLLAVVRYAAVAALLAINVISLHSFGQKEAAKPPFERSYKKNTRLMIPREQEFVSRQYIAES